MAFSFLGRRCAALRLPLLAVAVLAVPAAQAQPVAQTASARLLQLDLEELMKVEIVSASRRTQALGDVAAAVHVITHEDIRRAGARSLAEALRLAPGMDVTRLSGAYHAVTARGFPGRYADKLQVLIDGRSVYWEMFSGVQWEAERVPMDDIERIEVIRGPAGAVWGANAVNGVVNVITRAAADTPGTRMTARAATQGEHALTLEHGWRAGDGPDVRLYAQQEGSGALRTATGAPANDRSRAISAGLRADWLLPDFSRLSVHGDVVRSDSGAVWHVPLLAPPYAALVPAPQRVERATLGSSWKRTVSPVLDLAVQGSVSVASLDNGDLGHYHGRTAELDARGHWRLAAGHDLILGVGGRWTGSAFDTPAQSLLLRFDPAYRTLNDWGLYAQDERVLAEHWRLTLGGRIGHHSLVGTTPQPSARLLWNLSESTSLWTALSRAVRVPSRVENDALNGLGVVAPGTVANPGALPLLIASRRNALSAGSAETVDALEAGWRTQWSPTLSLDVAAFANRYRGMTLGGGGLTAPEPVALPQPHLLALLDAQVGSVRSNGLEVAVDWRVTPGWRQQLSWSALRFNGAASSLPLAAQASPRSIVQLRSSFDLSANATLDLLLRHNSERGSDEQPALHTPALTELDAHLVWRLSPALDLTFTGRNLLHRARVQAMPDFGLYEPVRIERSFGLGLQARF